MRFLKAIRRHFVLSIFGFAFIILGALWVLSQEALFCEGPLYKWGSGKRISKRNPPIDTMVRVPGGIYVIGDERKDARKDAKPRVVHLAPFYIDAYPVTNQQYSEFVQATGYITEAENMKGGWVYQEGGSDFKFIREATWQSPLGPGSDLSLAWDHPVVLVSWEDANAYAQWAKKRLPTEAEWEIACRACASFNTCPVENPAIAENPQANVWQGKFPLENTLKDGYFYTSPVGAFSPNTLGVHDMIGNVWEWTASDYLTDTPNSRQIKVARGGSWFCSELYCGAYWPGFRGKSPAKQAFNNVGFRCSKDIE